MLNITHEIRKLWETEGYLHIPNVLEKNELVKLKNAADEVIERYTNKEAAINSSEQGNRVLGKHNSESYNILQAIEYTDAFDYLLDHPKLFNIILGIMGNFLQASGCDLFVRNPSTCISSLNKFHTDGGPSLQNILPQKNTPPLLIKVQYLLTDLTAEDAGNFTVVPGSHLKRVGYYDKNCLIRSCNEYVTKGEMPPDSKQIIAKAGDAIMHVWTLWHAVSPNNTETIRKSISIRYSQLWSRPYYKHISDKVMSRLTIRQKRLLGYLGENPDPTEFYTPADQQEIILDA